MSLSPRRHPRVPRPVKKRGRYAHPAPPDGFDRYELEEEGSSEDPDFEADPDQELEEPEDDDDSLDEPQAVRSEAIAADAEVSRILHDGRDPGRLQGATQHGMLGEFSGNFGAEEPQFEVDDLESTEEEDYEAEGGFAGGIEEPITPDRYDLEALEDDDEDVGDVDDAELDDDDTDQQEGGAEKDGPRDDYVQFLLGLLNPESTGPATSEAPPSASNDLPPSWALDDDDDFDYLRESAQVQDDPLEYRADLHVSRKELIQLLFNSQEGGLRRQTRNRVKNTSSTAKYRRVSAASRPAQVPPPPPLLPGAPPVGSYGEGGPAVPVTSGGMSMQPVAAGASASFVGLPAPMLYQYREQLGIFVHILTTIHAETRKKARMEASAAGASEATDNSEKGEISSPARQVASRSEKLILALMENTRISTEYHEMLSRSLGRLKPFSERLLNRDKRSGFAYVSCRTSAYDLPVLKLLDPFLKACRTAEVCSMPTSVLEPLRPYFRQDITQALSKRARGRQYSAAGSKPGWFAWTAADDNLLAMTMAKYGSEYGQFSRDLLPHRLEEDCQTRVRYLSSRRCPDNAVKRQVMFIAAPLNRDEVALVRRGLEIYGQRGLGEEDVWRKIQRELLPGREWSHLQKLWKWRETRRRYKAQYRAKVRERNRGLREGGSSDVP